MRNVPILVGLFVQWNLDLCHTLPAKTPKGTEGMALVLAFHHGDEVILVQRPGEGIWAGLWSFPESTLLRPRDTPCSTNP